MPTGFAVVQRQQDNSHKLPPLQNEQRLFARAPSTMAAVYTVAGPLGATVRTVFRVPAVNLCSPLPPFASKSSSLAYCNGPRHLPRFNHSRDGIGSLTGRIRFDEGHLHARRRRIEPPSPSTTNLSTTFREPHYTMHSFDCNVVHIRCGRSLRCP